MRSSLAKSFLITASLLSIFSCDRVPVAGGGTGTETINTFAVLSDGTPARGAQVLVIDPIGWTDSIRVGASPIIEQTTADSMGHVIMTLPQNLTEYTIQIDHPKQGSFLPKAFSTLHLGDTIRLANYASYTKSLGTSSAEIIRLFLAGTNYQATKGPNGNFFFSKVAAGSFPVIGATGAPLPYKTVDYGTVTLSTGVQFADTAAIVQPKRLLVDDFQNGIGLTAIGKVYPLLAWYGVSDSGYYKWVDSSKSLQWASYSPSTSGHSYMHLDTIEANGSKAMEFKAVINSANSSPYAIVGFSFSGFNSNGVDLSAMTGFSLRAGGTGVIWVRIETHNLDSTSQTISNYTYPIQLTDSMRNYQIPVDSLRILPAFGALGQYPFAEESKQVIDIEFEFAKAANQPGDSLRLVLDDFYLDGVTIDAFSKYVK